jgi:poly(3-hydroxyalkanoate) synthetase
MVIETIIAKFFPSIKCAGGSYLIAFAARHPPISKLQASPTSITSPDDTTSARQLQCFVKGGIVETTITP